MQESRAITRKSASNLALAFVLLPKAKRDGMSALYAFCREVDDVADNESVPVSQRREQLAAWRADVRRACGAETPQFPVNRELQPVIRHYRLPFEHFDALLQGVRNGPRHQALRELRPTGAVLLSRRLGCRPAEHRGFWLPGPGLPRLTRSASARRSN